MMDIKMKVLPPMFKVEAAFFADILGFQFGASLKILWKNIKDFEASFVAEPMNLAGGAFKLLKSDTQKGGPAGPNCMFSTSKKKVQISGKICLIGVCVDTFLFVSPTKFLF